MSEFIKKTDSQPGLFSLYPGSHDLDLAVRGLISEAIKSSPHSREQIAEGLSRALAKEVTVAMLDAFTAESKRQHRFPLAWINAFCFVTGDFRPLAVLVERAGFQMVTPAHADVARKFLDRERAVRELQIATDLALSEEASR